MKFESMFSPPVVRSSSVIRFLLPLRLRNQPTIRSSFHFLHRSASPFVKQAGGRERREVLLATHSTPRTHSRGGQTGSQSRNQPASHTLRSVALSLLPSFPLRSIGGTRRRRELKHLTRPPQRTTGGGTDGRVVNFLLTSSSPAAARAAARRRSPIPQRNVVRRERGRGEQAVEEAAAEAAGALKPSCATTWKRRRRRHSTLKCGDFGGLVLSPVKRGRRHMPHLLRRGNIFQRHEAR